MHQPTRTGIDPRAPRFGQALTGALTLAAFLLDAPLLVAAVALVLGPGALLGAKANLWARIYQTLVQPRLEKPNELEHPAPPRFATTLGFLFLTGGIPLIALASPPILKGVGWGLVLTVSGLALFAAISGICLGCELYVRLQRLRGATIEPEGSA